MLEREVLNLIDKEELIEFIKSLISIPSHKLTEGQERQLGRFLADTLAKEGIEVHLQEVGDCRANVIGLIKGTEDGQSLMLNGHLDTVPPLDMPDPFTPRIMDGKLYGRGAADMKAGLGAMAYALMILQRAKIKLQGTLLLAGVIGEESGGIGTAFLVRNGPRADMAIVGEPTDLDIVIAHKGTEWLEIAVKGKAAHGSVPQEGVSAIIGATKVIQAIQERLVPKLQERRHELLNPPTINIGVIRGGEQPNIVPDECRLQLDRRWLPTETLESVIGELQHILAELAESDPRFCATLRRMEETSMVPHHPLETSATHPLVRTLKEVLQELRINSSLRGVDYWTDGASLSQAGIPTVVFGPGSIAQAHSDEEFVKLESVLIATKAYILTALRICKGE